MPGRWLLFVPMYNCAPQIGRTLAQVAPLQDFFGEVLVVDNGSSDGGPERAIEAVAALDRVKCDVVRNDRNVGLGGSHKVGFQRCLDGGFDGMIVFHGDDQGRLSDLTARIDDHPDAECILGARFMPGSRLEGYSAYRIAGNIVFNAMFSTITRRVLWDLGSGLNAYRRVFVERRLWSGCADDLTFNYHLILRTAAVPGLRFAFVPISWREDDQISNAKLWKHGRTTLGIVSSFTTRRRSFLSKDHGTPGIRTYTRLGGRP